jgi:hypothetical protein
MTTINCTQEVLKVGIKSRISFNFMMHLTRTRRLQKSIGEGGNNYVKEMLYVMMKCIATVPKDPQMKHYD